MYVNTLITLQENLSTYGIDGKKVTGHVTITSPGLIKCYVQNLKKQVGGRTYAFYAFSKTRDKGIRLGSLSNDKETKWIINGNNIENSGINLEELDGVAIVVEDDMRGVDTILMGFKNNRYMIIPLIDEIFKKQVRPGKSGVGHGTSSHKPEYNEKAQPKQGISHETSSYKPSAWSGNLPPKNEIKTGKIVEPDILIEGPGPVIIPNPGKPPQGGPGPVIIPNPGKPPQGGPGPGIIPNPGKPPQGGPGPGIYETEKEIAQNSQVGNEAQEKRMEAVDLELLKIAERLKQIGRQSNGEQEINSDDSLTYENTLEDSRVREDDKKDENEISRELQRIINMLKENQEVKEKTKGIEEQIEKMRRLPQTHKLVEKSNLEKTLESRYMAQQVMDEEEESLDRKEDTDTSPRNVLNFISQETKGVEIPSVNEQDSQQIENLDKKESVDCQDEIDYINEIDKKIREIESRRKQQETNRY